MNDLYDMVFELQQQVADLKASISNTASKGTLLEPPNDGEKLQTANVRGRYSEEFKGLNSNQSFGFSSNPPAGSEVIIMSLGGDRDSSMIVSMSSQDDRPKGGAGGSSVQYDTSGSKVYLDAGGNITIECSGNMTLKAANIALDGNVSLGGGIGSGVPASMEGTLDTAFNADATNLATKVKVN